jgi:hypothetical protein
MANNVPEINLRVSKRLTSIRYQKTAQYLNSFKAFLFVPDVSLYVELVKVISIYLN